MQQIIPYLRGAVRSWTIWVNSVLLTLVLAAPLLQDTLPTIKPFVSEKGFGHLTMIVILLNLALRVKTNQSLSTK